jgi:hypothetical protein
MSLSKLPYEIICLIVQDLELDDVFHLSLSPRFSYLIKEDRVCMTILEVLFKRTQALPSPEPVQRIQGSALGSPLRGSTPVCKKI